MAKQVKEKLSKVRAEATPNGVWFGGIEYFVTDKQLAYINTRGIRESDVMELYGLEHAK